MSTKRSDGFSRRERQVMDVLYSLGKGTVAEVLQHLPDPPSYSAVRTHLRLLEEKGHVRHEVDGPRYVFVPTVRRDRASRSALQHLVQTFFDGSVENAMAALVETSSSRLSEDALARMATLIEQARKEGR